jgi:hypothetical protein
MPPQVRIPNFIYERFLTGEVYFRFVENAINGGRRHFTCRDDTRRGIVYATDNGEDDAISIRLLEYGYINNGPSIQIHGLDRNYLKNEQYCTRKIRDAVDEYILTARRERTTLMKVVTSKTGQTLPRGTLSRFF